MTLRTLLCALFLALFTAHHTYADTDVKTPPHAHIDTDAFDDFFDDEEEQPEQSKYQQLKGALADYYLFLKVLGRKYAQNQFIQRAVIGAITGGAVFGSGFGLGYYMASPPKNNQSPSKDGKK